MKSENKQVVLAENSSTLLMAFSENNLVNSTTRKRTVLHAELLVDNEKVSPNNYYFEKPKNLELSKVKVKLRQLSEDTIEVTAPKMAKTVWLFLPGVDNAFTDNYFDLIPCEKRSYK